MEQMLGQYKRNKIELVLANNDDMALGVLDNIKFELYRDTFFPVFIGTDGTDMGLKAMEDPVWRERYIMIRGTGESDSKLGMIGNRKRSGGNKIY